MEFFFSFLSSFNIFYGPITLYLFRMICILLVQEILKALGYRPQTPLVVHPLHPDKPFVAVRLIELMIWANLCYFGWEVMSIPFDPTIDSGVLAPLEFPGEVDFSFYEVEYVPETEDIPEKPRLSFSTYYKDPEFMVCLSVVVGCGVALLFMK